MPAEVLEQRESWAGRIQTDHFHYSLVELMAIQRWLIVKYADSYGSEDEIWDMAHIENSLFDEYKRLAELDKAS